MDAFFAAIEQRDHPELRGKPVIVGAAGDRRGVVSTCSYEARRFGVHSAMPSRTAAKLCPHGIFVPVDMHKYHLVSQQIHALFSRFTPLVEPVSVDEAFLDVTGSLHLFGGAEAVARKLKEAIWEETRLTSSVGVAPNKFLAKLASDMNKPDGLTMVPFDPDAIARFLAPLPVRRIWGIGEKGAERLHAVGLRTIGDLQQAPLSHLVRLLGDKGGLHVHELAFGRDTRQIALDVLEKSISHEHTFGDDCHDRDLLEATLRELVQKVGRRLRKHGMLGTTGQLKLRWSDFTTITRQRALPIPTHADQTLLDLAMELFAEAMQPRPVRLIGFGVSGLLDESQAQDHLVQPDLFDDPVARDERRDQVDHALDRIRAKYGDKSIRRGD